MKECADSQQFILELMGSDINAGTAAAFEAYGGLVWSACARRLEDPEDIRECVNDTFLAFSTGYDKFDPEKGSLGNYLCVIALRRATERYRKNQAVSRAEDQCRINAPLYTEEAFDSCDLADALAQLDPVDARILREKYYDGMTYQQIAEAIGLPYDTVKKRGQRSLKKLRFILIGLILALLAAGCAYLVYCSYQFAEGAGPNFDPNRPIYQLSAVEGEAYALDAATYFVENAIYQDGEIYVKIGVLYNRTWPKMDGEPSAEFMQASTELRQMLCLFTNFRIYDEEGAVIEIESDGFPSGTYHDNAGKGTIEKNKGVEFEQPGESLTLQIRLDRSELSQENLQAEYLDTGILTDADMEKLEQTLPVWTITLKKVDFTDEEHEEGQFFDYLDSGFMVRDGVAYPGSAHVSLYPYQTESAYTLSSMLLHNYSGYYDDRGVTLTAEDGTVYPADQIRGASISPLLERQIIFPGATAGEYVLTIPYLCMYTEETTQTVTLPVPTQPGQRVTLDETICFSDGSWIHMTGIRLERRTVECFFAQEDGSVVVRDIFEWDYILECEPLSAGTLELIGARGCGELSAPGRDLTFELSGNVIGPDSRELTLSVTQSNYSHTEYEEGGAYVLSLAFDTPTYILDQQIEIPVTVHEYDHE